jgi:hypothetical protein
VVNIQKAIENGVLMGFNGDSMGFNGIYDGIRYTIYVGGYNHLVNIP